MAAEQFKVERYGVDQGRIAAGPLEGRTASLALYGPVVNGIRKQAYLNFSPVFTGFSGEYQDSQFSLELPYDDFSAMYDLLRHEAPVYAFYSYADGTTELLSFRLRTDDSELPGEGPADTG
jgi:hypothetical protein